MKVLRMLTAVAAVTLCSAMVQAQSHDDKEFLEQSSQGNVAEVELAKLALSKTSNPQIKMFAKKMIHDHEMLARNMKPFLVNAGVQPSTSLNSEHQALYNKLKELNGDEFNKEYVEDMDKDHHKDLEAFQKEIASTQDASLKAAVEKGETVIAQHTRMIDGISKGMGMQPAGA